MSNNFTGFDIRSSEEAFHGREKDSQSEFPAKPEVKASSCRQARSRARGGDEIRIFFDVVLGCVISHLGGQLEAIGPELTWVDETPIRGLLLGSRLNEGGESLFFSNQFILRENTTSS